MCPTTPTPSITGDCDVDFVDGVRRTDDAVEQLEKLGFENLQAKIFCALCQTVPVRLRELRNGDHLDTKRAELCRSVSEEIIVEDLQEIQRLAQKIHKLVNAGLCTYRSSSAGQRHR